MEKVVNKYFINGCEVIKVVEQYSTTIYKSFDTYYITVYGMVIAEFKNGEVTIPEEYLIKNNEEN